ncbi:MAG: ATP-binding protein, partial [Bacteroidales bacterium]|nr:ATP-binding protein [Bacteroidales bacterium]
VKRHLDNYVIHAVSLIGGSKLSLSTDAGLVIYDYENQDTQLFTTAQGLPSNAIYATVPVSDNELWVSSNRGLSRVRLKEQEVSNYNIYDGLQSNEFYKNSYLSDADGRLWFGGMEGITYFNPKEVGNSTLSFEVRVTQRRENSLEMAVVPLLYTHRARYSYSLNGQEWIDLPAGVNIATLPYLSSGSQTFRYKASVDGVLSEEKTLKFLVPYPWYLQWWFLLLCLAVAIAAAFELSLHLHQRRHDKASLARHEQLQAINDAKLQFFTNISHEIRTPMTLIVSPLQRLMDEDKDVNRQHSYKLMQRSANRILGLINQLLDLRKIDNNEMKLLCAETDLAAYLEELVSDFSEVADMRQQKLSFVSKVTPGLRAWVDVDNFDKIVVNLLSNALKYTPQEGSITVRLCEQRPTVEFPQGSYTITVADTGIGIAPEDRAHIFERFYQVRNSKGKYGTGIGLHLTQTLVKMHRGTIEVGNNPDGPGTIFVVTLPLGGLFLAPDERSLQNKMPQAKNEEKAPDTTSIAAASLTNDKEEKNTGKHLTRKHVLVVDDDDEIR